MPCGICAHFPEVLEYAQEKGIPYQLELMSDATGTNADHIALSKGGIKTDKFNPITMESKLVKGLYFAGEIIDVDAYTGGYNLQIAFSTGHLAGESAATD